MTDYKDIDQPFHVRTTPGGKLARGLATETAAAAWMTEANRRAEALGIATRYEVVPNEKQEMAA